MAVAFGPGGKMVKGAMTGAMAMGMDPAEAEAGVFGRLAKWGQSREGRAAFNDALKMSTKGADNADVFAKTGWFKDVDGHWKFWRSSQGGGIAEPYQGSSLAAVYNDPFLFDQYPHMKNIGHRRKNSNGAHWDEQANEIVVGDTSAPFFQKPEVGGRKGVLDHEIYHAKSTYEGWPQGTSQFGGSVKLGDDIRRLQNIQRTEPGKLVEDDPFWSAIGGIDNYTPLSDLRYRAEMGEALARREASIREFGPDNLRGITPADASLIDMPMNTLFHPGETATMDQYNALIKFLDEKRAQDAALAAKGDVTFGDTEALRVRMGGAPKRKK